MLKVKVSHAFKETYDSASIMVMQDMKNWAKCCFELTDFGTHAAVSIPTNMTAEIHLPDGSTLYSVSGTHSYTL